MVGFALRRAARRRRVGSAYRPRRRCHRGHANVGSRGSGRHRAQARGEFDGRSDLRTAFSAADLAQANIYDLQSLKDVAGFTFQQTASTGAGGRNEGSIIFRGLQSTYGDVQREFRFFVRRRHLHLGRPGLDQHGRHRPCRSAQGSAEYLLRPQHVRRRHQLHHQGTRGRIRRRGQRLRAPTAARPTMC
jgi:hypothetical protein